MMMFIKKLFLALTILTIIASLVLVINAQEIPKAELPLLITSAGQSPDLYQIAILCKRTKIEGTSRTSATVEDMENIKTIIFAMGGSTKGLGAAGIDEDQELARIESLLDKAEKEEILIIGIHIGGVGRRGALSMKFIELVSRRSDYLVVTKEGNKDGYFTDLGKELKIPLTVVEQTMDVGKILIELFQKDETS